MYLIRQGEKTMINGIKPVVGNTTKTQKVNGKNGLSFDEAMDAKVDGTHKGVPMLKGDILKAATWSQPAKHSRGSIFDSEMHKSFSWTGPNYL
jgi:hypothetical protein